MSRTHKPKQSKALVVFLAFAIVFTTFFGGIGFSSAYAAEESSGGGYSGATDSEC